MVEKNAKKILLINPSYRKEMRYVTGKEQIQDMVPVSLATIAALTPKDYHVDIWDEAIRGIIDENTCFPHQYDLVGITGFRHVISRAKSLARIFRKRGIIVVFGGPGVSGSPDQCREDFDSLFIGEAEKTWPQFLREWESGNYRKEYRQIEKIDLKDSPIPDFSSIAEDIHKYGMGCVQTTRGCPFDCEFCDVIYLYGRQTRHKPIHNVLEEVKQLQRMGASDIFLSDDNFIGDVKYAKALLKELIPLNNSFDNPLTFSTQITVNVSNDDELLAMLADANFYILTIGIETPSKSALKETGKHQNIRKDLLSDLHHILSYGLLVRGSFIVGFDADDTTIFDTQFDFIQKACIPNVTVNMLRAAIGTRLWARLRREGRVLDISDDMEKGMVRFTTNIIPKNMSRVELMQGFRTLMGKIFEWQNFSDRLCGWISKMHRMPAVKQPSVTREDILNLRYALHSGLKAQEVLEKIADHTQNVAPNMMDRVLKTIILHDRNYDHVQDFLSKMDAYIKTEMSGKTSLKLDNRPVLIPTAFRENFRTIFSDVYKYIDSNLFDKEKIPEALTEVFVDFLVRCGYSFEKFEEYHNNYLKEICDRTCAKYNQIPPQDFIAKEPEEKIILNTKHVSLGDEVLKAVDQELIKLALTE